MLNRLILTFNIYLQLAFIPLGDVINLPIPAKINGEVFSGSFRMIPTMSDDRAGHLILRYLDIIDLEIIEHVLQLRGHNVRS